MTCVRFKEEYSDSNPRIAYELVSEEMILEFDEVECRMSNHYNLKIIGLVPARKLEITTDPNDIAAIGVFIKLSNL